MAIALSACGAAAPPISLPSLPLPLPPDDPSPAPNAVGLVPLPCREAGPLRPVHPDYCRRQRQYVTPQARAALLRAAAALQQRHPGRVVRYMEASWPQGRRPMPPHLSHGDGRQIDIVVFYEDRAGRPVRQPTASGCGGFEPPEQESQRVCAGVASTHSLPDPPRDRPWRLDDEATADLVRLLLRQRAVRRIFIEPHLKERLGFARERRVRFAGCNAARHDDHLHVDFH